MEDLPGSKSSIPEKYPPAKTFAKLCFEKFNALPKTGKPIANEWTVLAGVVRFDAVTGKSKVVALGCGTKCIGHRKLCTKGLILSDSHAEVLARRAFMRYIYHELKKAIAAAEASDSFTWQAASKKYAVRSELSWHFVSTQVPCGDACILGAAAIDTSTAKRQKLIEDEENQETVYTGAKLISGAPQLDALRQTVGALRIKPGKGDRTLSMSCSDKLAKWQVLGIQGAMLFALLEQPIYFASLNFCCAAEQVALERAIYRRWESRQFQHPSFQKIQPAIRICEDLEFAYRQHTDKQPSPNGLVWCDLPEKLKPHEISVNGKRQGVTSKKLDTPHAALKISRFHLLEAFIELLEVDALRTKFNLEDVDLRQMPYIHFKQLAKSYQDAWTDVKENYFQQWTTKAASYQQFSVNQMEQNKTS